MKYKQVIVMRHDLHMRMGKAVAQGAHAAMMFLLTRLSKDQDFSEAEVLWCQYGMAKICVRVESEAELLEIHQLALAAGLTSHLITDAGHTEFDGPTKTCIAIGPDLAEKIDTITGKLKLL